MIRLHTHCGRGHELTPENVYVTPRGNRQCRICKLEANRAWRKGQTTKTPFTYCRQGHLLSVENTYISARGQRACKTCQAQRQKEQYLLDGGAAPRHGLTAKEHEQLWESQDKRCAICGKNLFSLGSGVIDHDHVTGHVRGILCAGCNTAIGQLGDSAELLMRAVHYLNASHLSD